MNIFLNLDSSDFLIEYIYGDIGSTANTINTDNAPFYLMENNYTSETLLMNRDGFGSLTNNTRDISIANIEESSKRFALLTTNKLGPAYNDYDDSLTNTDQLNLDFSNPEGIEYDTVRVHLIQGFSFNDDFTALDINVKVQDKTGLYINLLSGIYKAGDKYETMNPQPFLYSGRQYASYLEFKVPSLRYLIDSYNVDYVGGANSDILAYKITNGNGFYKNTLVEVTAGRFGQITKTDNQLYTKLFSSESTSISSKDSFSEVGVFIGESTSGDFIEFYGTHNGEIFSDYMQRLNTSGSGQYIAIHKLIITEQLPNTTGEYNMVGYYNPLTNIPDLGATAYVQNFTDGDYWVATGTGFSTEIDQSVVKGNFVVYNPSLPTSIKVEVIDSYDIESYGNIAQFIRSSEQEFVQDSDFGDANTFRPVLKYGGSDLSYRIDYTLKIYNTNTNSIVEKRGSYVSFNPQKYGKELLKLNTRDNIQIFDVFNKKVTNNITQTVQSSSNQITDSSLYNKNITSFTQTQTVYAGSKEVSIDNEGNIVPKANPDAQASLLPQGISVIYISPFDTFINFNLYQQKDNSFKSIDITKVGLVYLNFTNKDGEIIKVESTKNKNIDEAKGQILFRIRPEIYNQIINSSNDVFFITTKSGDNSPETSVYTGRYKDAAKIVEDETQLLIEQQRQAINDLNDTIEDLNNNIEGEIEKRIKIFTKNFGNTADDKSINDGSLNLKNSPFNPFGPTSGPTSLG